MTWLNKRRTFTQEITVHVKCEICQLTYKYSKVMSRTLHNLSM